MKVGFYKLRTPAESSPKDQLLVPVGWHAFVNGPQEQREGILTMSGDGQNAPNNLADGEEVEILSWRPRMRDGTRYQIRRLSDKGEWWIAAAFLRKTPARAA